MTAFIIPVWKESPFLRILVPFLAGMLVHSMIALPPLIAWLVAGISFSGVMCFSVSGLRVRYGLQRLAGLFIYLLLMASGYLLCLVSDRSAGLKELEDLLIQHPLILVTVKEPPSERKSSWKALTDITAVRSASSQLHPVRNREKGRQRYFSKR